ncbi:MAG TPA: nucleotidyltransferase domain-containing protein [Ignavibacteriaceae bacterium]|nr:nucleotidyltransferase domain-containing protein [Ignavibacteriaceae bacterium]
MRLKKEEIKIIKTIINEFDPKGEIRLFGSRIDDKKTGGDIDLLLISDIIKFPDKLSILVKLKEKLGDQKIDILIYNPKETFHRIAYKESIIL